MQVGFDAEAVDLVGTGMDPESYCRREIHRSDDDWCVTWTEDGTFQAACGPANLTEALHEFRRWVVCRTS